MFNFGATAGAAPLTSTINSSNVADPTAKPTFSGGGGSGGAGAGSTQNGAQGGVALGGGLSLPQTLAGAPLAHDLVPLGQGNSSDSAPMIGSGTDDQSGGSQTSPQFADPGGTALTGSGKLELQDLLAHHSPFLSPH
jgi:hypothetical protein